MNVLLTQTVENDKIGEAYFGEAYFGEAYSVSIF